MQTFFELLFDEHESTCFADTPKGTRVLQLADFDPSRHAYFSINPLDSRKDRTPLASYHHPHRPRRADHNVTSFRNILVELDKGPLTEQWALISRLALPYSSCVYSGGKSYHFILSLAQPLADRASYDALVKRIYRVLGDRIDPACKNPSRLSRTPGHFREETARFQNLCALRERVSLEELEHWLEAHGAARSVPNERPGARAIVSGALARSTVDFLQEGAAEGSWNNSLFKAACDAFSKSWAFDDFVQKAEGITGHLDFQDLMTIRSAWQRAGKRAG